MSCLVVFSREPTAGRTKTRLAARLGAEVAAAVASLLLETTVNEVASCEVPAFMALAEPPTSDWAVPPGLAVEVQPAGDLGDRLAGTFARRFGEGWQRVVLVGSDCPGIRSHHLLGALEELARVPVVLGPASDGGYWLVGQRAPGADLFSGIPWSSPETLAATRRRLTGLGLPWRELEHLDDVDSAADIERVLGSSDVPEPVRSALARIVRRRP